MNNQDGSLLKTIGLKKYFRGGRGILKESGVTKAVDDVSLAVYPGETVGLVGESGCGKSTLARTVLRLYDPTSGQIHFEGHEISSFTDAMMKTVRKDMQMIFQDPFSSLNPARKAWKIVSDPMRIHRKMTRKGLFERAASLLELVGLHRDDYARFPHEFSGGQAQRLGIARALSLDPNFVAADEPVSALDISIQAQILNLMMELQERLGLSYLFITHDMKVTRHIADRVIVMYLGRFIETGHTNEVFARPLHPYTQALLSVVPSYQEAGTRMERIVLEGEIPSAARLPTGCKFYSRCRMRMDVCKEVEPELKAVEGEHMVRCHLY